ncbi:DUF397 domain-containing protein [Streptomyces sp. NPDC054884]|uniref:DUF397 domain-containing protein n=1 Tax=Streptomyces sp. ME08-AFT2 TaxID=3028683 RepID=UPI0029A9A82F|nr:DUF397 domain-containing protein [Streptomyces sp. ME08-AFT2]MDX3307807.1 DUF397 domain-containing protein [Streptomyces sp. ME08-AFT2]
MRALDLSNATWRKSGYSNPDAGECLEVADQIPAVVPVRDSKAPERGAVLFGLGAWASFVDALKQS